jgi:hypothetical protein
MKAWIYSREKLKEQLATLLNQSMRIAHICSAAAASVSGPPAKAAQHRSACGSSPKPRPSSTWTLNKNPSLDALLLALVGAALLVITACNKQGVKWQCSGWDSAQARHMLEVLYCTLACDRAIWRSRCEASCGVMQHHCLEPNMQWCCCCCSCWLSTPTACLPVCGDVIAISPANSCFANLAHL